MLEKLHEKSISMSQVLFLSSTHCVFSSDDGPGATVLWYSNACFKGHLSSCPCLGCAGLLGKWTAMTTTGQHCSCVSAQILELLVQKCLTSANPDYTRPGDAFRRVMECVASGIFLPGMFPQ